MGSLNVWHGIGNAGKDAEIRYLTTGTAQAQFSLACNYKSGDKEVTEWVNIVLWGDLAESVSQYITKGKQVYVQGRLQTRTWDGDDGAKHYRTEINAYSVVLLGSAGGGKRDDAGDWGDEPPQQQRTPARSQGNRGSAPRQGNRGTAVSQQQAEYDPGDLPFE
jgi:single-strand DNA-binding protein